MDETPVTSRRSSRYTSTGFALEPAIVGMITGILHADKDAEVSNACCKNFRASLSVTDAAVQRWSASDVMMVVQLGGVVDGSSPPTKAKAAMASVLKMLASWGGGKRLDVVSNHELQLWSRAGLANSGLLSFSDTGRLYRVEDLNHRWVIIVLDAYENSVVGRDVTDEVRKQSIEVLCKYNPKLCRTGLPEEHQRFVPSGGGASGSQLRWLDGELQAAKGAGKKALVFTHIPIYSGAAKPGKLMWNAEEVLEVLHGHRDVVVAVFAGHDLDGGYAVDPAGIHHVTLSAAVTAKIGEECCAVLECHEDGWARFRAYGKACAGHSELVLASKGIHALLAMGYEPALAHDAFVKAGGSVEGAVTLLS